MNENRSCYSCGRQDKCDKAKHIENYRLKGHCQNYQQYNEVTEFALAIHELVPVGLELSAAIASDLMEKGYRSRDEVIKEVFSEIAKYVNTSREFHNQDISLGYSWAVRDFLTMLVKLKETMLGEGESDGKV